MVSNPVLSGSLEQCDVEPVGMISVWPGSLFFEEAEVLMGLEESFDVFFSF